MRIPITAMEQAEGSNHDAARDVSAEASRRAGSAPASTNTVATSQSAYLDVCGIIDHLKGERSAFIPAGMRGRFTGGLVLPRVRAQRSRRRPVQVAQRSRDCVPAPSVHSTRRRSAQRTTVRARLRSRAGNWIPGQDEPRGLGPPALPSSLDDDRLQPFEACRQARKREAFSRVAETSGHPVEPESRASPARRPSATQGMQRVPEPRAA